MNELSPYSCFPIRPLNTDFYPVYGVDDGDDGWGAVEDSHIPAVSGDQQDNEPGDILDADDDEVVQRAVPMPAPITPSKREIETHNLTHLPYRSWCKHCVADHRRQPSSRQRLYPYLSLTTLTSVITLTSHWRPYWSLGYSHQISQWQQYVTRKGSIHKPLHASPNESNNRDTLTWYTNQTENSV